MSEEKKVFAPRFVHFMWSDELQGKEGFYSDSIEYLTMYVEVNAKEHKGCAKRNCQNGSYPFSIFFDGDSDSFKFFYYDPLYEYKLAYNQGKKVEVCGFVGISRAWIEVTDDWKWGENYEYRIKPEDVEKQEESLEYIAVLDETETPPKVLVTLAVSSMPLDWHVLTKWPLERCKSFAVERFCKRCKHEVSLCCSPYLGCQGFKGAREVAKEVKEAEKAKEVKKRRMTNRELAKWLAQSNGECVCDDISMTCWRYIYSEADTPVRDGAQIRAWDEAEWSDPLVEE